jgi:hypothetical protein
MGLGKKIDGKYQPISNYEGSWADVMKKARERTRREAEKDKRPSSLLAYEGVHTLSNGVKVEFTNTNRID